MKRFLIFALLFPPLALAVFTAPTLAAGQRGPAPAALHMDARIIALACAPSVVFESPLASLQVTGGQESFVRKVFVPGDLITINAGSDNGIEVGQEYYVRRVQVSGRRALTREAPGMIRTAGWIRVYAVDGRMALATITLFAR